MVRADRYTELTNKKEFYSDFLTDLTPHPVSGETLRLVNENAVTRSIKNLMNTNKGERLYQPDIGGDIRKLLFEPMTDATAEILSATIQQTITNYEPRAKVLDTRVIPYYDDNMYVVSQSRSVPRVSVMLIEIGSILFIII